MLNINKLFYLSIEGLLMTTNKSNIYCDYYVDTFFIFIKYYKCYFKFKRFWYKKLNQKNNSTAEAVEMD